MSKVVVFHGQDRRILVAQDGTRFGDLIAALDLPLEQPCAGRGTCGRCKVLVEKGGSAPDKVEREHLATSELAIGTRLACRARIEGDTHIVLSPAVVYSNKIFRAGKRHLKERDVPLGLAIDLGTTTVAAYLTMLDNGEVVAGAASLNQQRVYGADVISRISAAVTSPEHQERLYRLAVSSINQAINALSLPSEIWSRIGRVTVVGNVAMHHLLTKMPVETLAALPFQPFSSDSMAGVPGLLDSILPGDARVSLPPLIGGFVGSDALACLAYFDFDNPPGPQLAVDLGTNGEVLLTDGRRIVTASTAAGPAFEGVNISCGMRAVEGAIVDADLRDGSFTFQTIGDEPPLGLTGSGLLRVVYELVRCGVIDSTGRILDNPSIMGDQIERRNGAKIIFLTPERNVWLTQKDIRELQKAKGAILAAIEILMRNMGVVPAELERVILTGSFGGQLDFEAVLGLGMIPRVAPERILNIPNGAGMGAAMFLSDNGFALGERLARKAEQIDLEQDLDFQRIFVEALSLESGRSKEDIPN